MRGNRSRSRGSMLSPGSIPAHAGQPTISSSADMAMRVYPRACGATSLSCSATPIPRGLSPRMRGNRYLDRASAEPRRSIPAHAGQPQSGADSDGYVEVYPRACGATAVARVYLYDSTGLSPRMRGNPVAAVQPSLYIRSIPAHAGQPGSSSCAEWRSEVYPRACGATEKNADLAIRGKGLSPRMRGNRVERLVEVDLHGVYPRACGATTAAVKPVAKLSGLSPRMRGNHC